MVVLAETTKVGITSSLVMTVTLVQPKEIKAVQFISLGLKYRLLKMYIYFYNWLKYSGIKHILCKLIE